jgi:NAD(P)-dependent dehydrogenase (short-subunit alcohol dehydrogenase family)
MADMALSGKTAVVTGAASGIGRATAIGFGNEGANVALVDLDEDGTNQVAKEIDAAGVQTMVCKVDLALPGEIRSALHAVHQRFGSVDAVANVAGIYPKAKVADVTEELWDRILSINLRGVFFCCQDAIQIMVAQGSGAIVNVASGAAFRAIEGHAVYSASKAGLVGMTRVLALECARKGVRVNIVAPGHTPSERWHDKSQMDPAVAETLVPGRFMTPEEQANAIIWLCSDLASGVNGAIINVNGGNHMPQG